MGYYDDLLSDEPITGSADVVSTGSNSTLTSDAAGTTESTSSSGEPGDDSAAVKAEDATDEITEESAGADSGTGAQPAGNTVPASIAGRAVSLGLRPRFEGNKALNDLVRDDWIKAIKLNPDAFDALLYKAVSPSEVVIDDDGYEVMAAEKIDPNQETLTYADPELVVVVDCPDEMTSFYAMNDSDENAGSLDDALILRMATHNVPIGSILEWME
ncbi:hypothetical protein CYR55_23060, partial [Chimaeribacter californicus]